MTALFLPAGFLIAASLIVMSSLSAHLFFLQLAWVLVGCGIIALFTYVDWRSIFNHPWVIWGIYVLSILLLLVVLVKGPVIRNVHGWLVLGPFQFEPVELAKIGLILVYAQYFSRRHLSIARFSNIFYSFLIFAVPAALTLLQPDMGSTTILFGIWFGFLLLSGLPPRRIILAIGIFAVCGFLLWSYGFKPYQRARIVGVLYPERDALGINYSTIQSKIAIGSAGFWGKGYRQGTQTQLGFLTEPASDFVLAALVEEWGWIAGFLALLAVTLLIYKILNIGVIADQNFEKFICLGVAMVFGFQFLVNAGSATGILPVVGVTFPFLSYGGSSMIINFLLLGTVHAITRKS